VGSSGTNILGNGDSFHFVYKPVRGKSQLVSRILRVPLTDPWASAGLMMRESLAADAACVSLSATAGRGGLFGVRERKGNEMAISLDRALAVPCWLKLKRDGDVFTALRSTNGKQWWLVARQTLPMAEEIYVGLSAVAVRGETLNQTMFEEVEEAPALRNRWFTPQIELRSGSLQAGAIAAMDDTAIHFGGLDGKPPLSLNGVAQLRFQPVPSAWARLVSAGRKGILLTTGEFIESECRGIEAGTVTMSSVPLGLLRYDLSDEVIAVVLAKKTAPVRLPFTVRTIDGARWLALEVAWDQQWVTIREPLFGSRRLPIYQIAELRRVI
jgi:hypothetical protein